MPHNTIVARMLVIELLLSGRPSGRPGAAPLTAATAGPDELLDRKRSRCYIVLRQFGYIQLGERWYSLRLSHQTPWSAINKMLGVKKVVMVRVLRSAIPGCYTERKRTY